MTIKAKRGADPPEVDPLVDSVWIGGYIRSSSEHAAQRMKAGDFGAVTNIGTGDVRARLRVRRSAVERWIADRTVA